MKKIWYVSRVLALSLLFVLIFYLPSSHAVIPLVNCRALSGSPPVIDGVVSPGEWPDVSQMTIDPTADINPNEILTYFYCVNDGSNLYILVDAVGDQTDDSNCDECFFRFGLDPNIFDVDIWIKKNPLVTSGSVLPADSKAEIGFGTSQNDSSNDHRIYEFRIPLSSINMLPGQTIAFSSPQVGKYCFRSSMPFDGSTNRDNVWPPGLDPQDPSTYGQLQSSDPKVVPTLNEWGMIIFMVIAGLGSIYFLNKKRRES